MGARVAIALCIAALIAAMGLLLSRGLFDSSEEARREATPPPPRWELAADPPVNDDAADTSPRVVRVVSVEGSVDRRGEDGAWVPVAAGDELAAEDRIRTGDDGAAALDVGGVEVELDRSTELSVPSIEAAAGVELGQGRLSARVPGDQGGAFGVSVEGSDAIARSEAGEFAVLSDGRGAVAVAAIEGGASLTARNKTVEIAAGQQSLVRPGHEPSAPRAIPTSLFLKVDQPPREVRERQVTLRGQTAPGSMLVIDGRAVEVDARGRFTTVVALGEGRNRIRIRSRDVIGREQRSNLAVTAKTSGPEVGGTVSWGSE